MTPLASSTIGASVLVGVDGSPEAREAAVLGRSLARAAGGSLRLVTAAEQVVAEVVAIRSRIPTDRLHEALLDAARERAREALAQHFTPAELDTALIARLGRPEHVMVEVAREASADLLMVGGRRHGARRALCRLRPDRRPPASAESRRGHGRRRLLVRGNDDRLQRPGREA